MAVFGLVVTLLTGCANPRTEVEVHLDKTVETLLDAISMRDDGAILSLAANPPNFGEGGRLEDDVAGFLYDGDFVRTFSSDARSVVEIMALGPLQVHIVREEGGRATAIFAPARSGETAQVLFRHREPGHGSFHTRAVRGRSASSLVLQQALDARLFRLRVPSNRRPLGAAVQHLLCFNRRPLLGALRIAARTAPFASPTDCGSHRSIRDSIEPVARHRPR